MKEDRMSDNFYNHVTFTYKKDEDDRTREVRTFHPEAEYVKTWEEQDTDAVDATWEARVEYDADPDFLALEKRSFGQTSVRISTESRDYYERIRAITDSITPRVVITRNLQQHTVKLSRGAKVTRKTYTTREEGDAMVARLRSELEARGIRYEVWVPKHKVA